MLFNILTILLVSMFSYFFIRLYEKSKIENPSIIASQVLQGLLADTTAESVSRALSEPTYGDMGDFNGYDWPISKRSGLGGAVQLYNPTTLSMLKLGKYVPLSIPSIQGLT